MFETTNQQWLVQIVSNLTPPVVHWCAITGQITDALALPSYGHGWDFWIFIPPKKIWEIHENPRFSPIPSPSPYVALQSDFAKICPWFPKVRSSHLAGPLGSAPRVPPPPAHAHTCPAQPSEILFAPSGKHSKNDGKSPSLVGKSTMAMFNSYYVSC